MLRHPLASALQLCLDTPEGGAIIWIVQQFGSLRHVTMLSFQALHWQMHTNQHSITCLTVRIALQEQPVGVHELQLGMELVDGRLCLQA